MTQELKDKKLTLKVERRFKKAVDTYGLIPRGSTVVAAVSGGKDSLCLLELLTRDGFRKGYNIKVIAVHVIMENVPYFADIEFLKSFCTERDVKLEIRRTSFDVKYDTKKSPCYVCSRQRRKALYDVAIENDCNIIALGHHQDDMIETLMMNMAFQGSICSMPPILKMANFDMSLIRPLAFLSNQQMLDYAAMRQFPKMKKECPYEEVSSRSTIRGIIKQLEEYSPDVRTSMFAAMTNIQSDYLPHELNKS